MLLSSSSLFSFEGAEMQTKIVGVDCDEGTPVPIPNTVVKLIYADNTWLVTAREDRSMPTQSKTGIRKDSGLFSFLYQKSCDEE